MTTCCFVGFGEVCELLQAMSASSRIQGCSPYDTLKKTGGGGGEGGVGGGEGGGGGQLDGGGVGERRDVLKTHFKILKHSWYLLTNLGTGGSAPLHPPPSPSSPFSHNPPSNMHCSSSRSTVRTFTSMAADFHTLKQTCLFSNTLCGSW